MDTKENPHHRSQASVDRGVLDHPFVVVVRRHHHGARAAATLSTPELGSGQPGIAEILQQRRLGLNCPRDLLCTVHEKNKVVPERRRRTDNPPALTHRSRLLLLLLLSIGGCWLGVGSVSCQVVAADSLLRLKSGTVLTLLGPQSRFGDKLHIFRVNCPHIWECGSKRVNTAAVKVNHQINEVKETLDEPPDWPNGLDTRF